MPAHDPIMDAKMAELLAALAESNRKAMEAGIQRGLKIDPRIDAANLK